MLNKKSIFAITAAALLTLAGGSVAGAYKHNFEERNDRLVQSG
jgi:hypothetical protein